MSDAGEKRGIGRGATPSHPKIMASHPEIMASHPEIMASHPEIMASHPGDEGELQCR